MAASPNNAGVEQFVDFLAAFRSSDVLRHRQCRDALLDFIERSEDTTFCEEVADRTKRPRKRRRKDSGTTGSQTNAEAFFTSLKRIHGERGDVGRQASPNVQHLLQAVKDLECGMDTSSESYGRSEGTTLSEPTTNRQRCAIAKLDNIEKNSHVAEGRRRLHLLHIIYEVERLQHSAQREKIALGGRNIESDITAAERAFSELSGIDAKRVHALRRSARSYVNIASQKNGLGLLLMLGSQSRHLWERLSELGLSWLWQFCEENLQHVMDKAEILQIAACQLVEGDFRESGAELIELREDGHLFSKHFEHLRSGSFRPEQGPGLDSLAMAAEIMHERSQGILATGSTRLEDNGCSEVPLTTAGDHVTEVREGGETRSMFPSTVPGMEGFVSWNDGIAAEDWASILVATPDYDEWFDMLGV